MFVFKVEDIEEVKTRVEAAMGKVIKRKLVDDNVEALVDVAEAKHLANVETEESVEKILQNVENFGQVKMQSLAELLS